MANSWNGPQLGSPIRTDVPELQKKLIALLKQDPTSVADIPSGAKRLVNTSGVQWQVQQYNGSSWAAIGKLMHDVDKLDGYHAAITPAANTVAVRNANSQLEGDITGNAVTSMSATTLSQTLPVAKGGTGATTSAAARTNLGVPPTSHASSNTTYGLATDTNYGHVRSDGKTTNIVAGEVVVKDVLFNNLISLIDSGALGKAKYISSDQSFNIDTDDFDLVLINGGFENSSGTYPPFYGFVYIRQYYYSRTSSTNIGNRMQVAFAYSENKMWRRYYLNGSWSAWVKVIDQTDLATSSTTGIVKPGAGMSVDSAGSLGVNDTVVRTSESQLITGEKTFSRPLHSTASTLLKTVKSAISIADTSRPARTDIRLAAVEDKDNNLFGGVEVSANTDGSRSIQLLMRNRSKTRWILGFRLIERADGTFFAEVPTPAVDSNTNHVATTTWVRNYALPTSALIPSFATSMTGCLLCNGGAVSRTTYANLFGVIGTSFGEGDGSTTFNLPDFRNRTFWGADGNLMTTLAAGLPNITGGLSIGALTGNASGAIARESSTVQRSTTDATSSSGFTFNASRSSSIYGNSTTVQPPAIAVNIFIKY